MWALLRTASEGALVVVTSLYQLLIELKCKSEDMHQPCSQCIKRAARDQSIALRLCMGYNEYAKDIRELLPGSISTLVSQVRTNLRLDFFNARPGSSRHRLLDIWLGSSNAERRKLYFCYPPIEVDGMPRTSDSRLCLRVQGCADPTIKEEQRSQLDVHTVPNPKDINHPSSVYDDVPPQLTYHVVKDSLPSIEALFKWGRQGLIWRAGILEDDIESSLDMLLMRYASHNPPLPLVSRFISVDLTYSY
jgi:hypothetical protein